MDNQKELNKQLLKECQKGSKYFFNNIKQLIDKGADVNSQCQFGMTPLMFACIRGDLDLAMELHNSGAKLDIVDEYGWTALKYSLWHERDGVTIFLQCVGA